MLIEIRKSEFCGSGGQQSFILANQRHVSLWLALVIAEQYVVMHGIDAALDRLKNWQEIAMYQDDVIFGVIDGIEDLIWRKTHIDGMEHGSDHRHGIEAFEVAVTVPVHNRNGISGLDAEFSEGVGETADPLAQGTIIEAQLVAVHNLLGGVVYDRISEQVFNQQRIGISRCGTFNQQIIHNYSSREIGKSKISRTPKAIFFLQKA